MMLTMVLLVVAGIIALRLGVAVLNGVGDACLRARLRRRAREAR